MKQCYQLLQNPALTLPEGINSFNDIGLNKDIVSVLEQLGMSKPTNIQVRKVMYMYVKKILAVK